MTKQEHSFPILRCQVPEKRTEPKAHVVPTEEFHAKAPSHAVTKHDAGRRSEARIQYADESILRSVQEKCKDITPSFQHEAILYVGAEEYDYPTITILEGLQSLGFTVYTLKKPNINSWFCNEVLDSTSGLKVDFVLSNVGWGTRWSHYHRYQLKRFPVVVIDSVLTDTLDTSECSQRNAPDNADELEIQPYCWTDKSKAIVPSVLFSRRIQESIYLPPGIHHESWNAGVEFINANMRPRLIVPVHIPLQGQGEAIFAHEIASLIADDSNVGNVHGWHNWIRWRGTFDLLSKSAIAVCDVPGVSERSVWDALACGCLVMFNECDAGHDEGLTVDYPVTCISPFTVFQSEDELRDKLNWLTEHPDFLNRLRRDSERLALEYFTPAPLARRFLWHVHKATR